MKVFYFLVLLLALSLVGCSSERNIDWTVLNTSLGVENITPVVQNHTVPLADDVVNISISNWSAGVDNSSYNVTVCPIYKKGCFEP